MGINKAIDSRCGLHCTGCEWKESCGCNGCIETNGHPFHGECHIAVCCQEKGYVHCGECNIIPCNKLYAYTYLDPEHGDKPQGARVSICRRWAAENGKNIWKNVLLTSAGFFDFNKNPKKNIVDCFLKMLDKPIQDSKILFIQTAATDKIAKEMADKCKQELLLLGATEENIITYDVGDPFSEKDALLFDAVYFTGGDTAHLLRRMKDTGFDNIIKSMVYANKVYVGVSAGSLIATPNIGKPYEEETSGLCFINAYLSVHCETDTQGKLIIPSRTDLPLPHISLTDNQAIAVSWEGYHVIEG